MSFSMLSELFKYIFNAFRIKEGICDVVIVRRYHTPTGWNGELYLGGRQLGVTCDTFNGALEIYRQPLRISLEHGQRVLLNDAYVLTRGEFTSTLPFNTCYVGSLDKTTNGAILAALVDAASQCKEIRLTVLNRVWSELAN